MVSIKSRKCFLDLLRIIACFLVIVNHTNSRIFLSSNPENFTWFVSITYFFVSKIAVPIFLMISGYLLLNKIDTWKKTFNRIFRIVIVLSGCGFIYAIYRVLHLNVKFSIPEILVRTFGVFFYTPSNALWYMYIYLGILLMLPFLQKMTFLMTKKDYHIFFIISGFFFSLWPIASYYFPIAEINSHLQLPLFSSYICMLLIGQYFSRFEIKKTKLRFFISIVLFIISLAFNVVATFFEYNKSSTDYLFFDNRTLLPIMLQSICVFYIVSFVKVPEKLSKIISYIGSCTFGIFLISDINIELLKPIYMKISANIYPIFAVIMYEISVFVVGFIIIVLLKKIPFIKKVL